MAKYTQANRPMRVDTALGEDVLLLEGFSGDEAVSAPFGYTLDLLSEDPAVAASSVLRTPMSVTIKTLDGSGERFIHGLVRSFASFRSLSSKLSSLTINRPPVRRSFRFVTSAAGFMATKASRVSPGV